MKAAKPLNDGVMLEIPPCPLCGSQEIAPNKSYGFEHFRVVQCASCKLWYLSPRLYEQDILKAYGDDTYYLGNGQHGYAGAGGRYEEQEQALRATFRCFLETLHSYGMASGSLLEIGAGFGYLLDESRKYFTRIAGTDYSVEAVKRIRSMGFEAVLGSVEQLSQDQFNVILSIGVIEHIYDPVRFVRQLRRYLLPSGWIVLATPAMDSFWRKLMGQRWPSFKIPEHVSYYDEDTLTELFRRCGATIWRRLPYPAAYPWGLIGAKFGFKLPPWLTGRCIWLPGTMIALAARFD